VSLTKAEKIRRDINKALGAEVLTTASDKRFLTRTLSTGVLPIDVLLDGGLPRNRCTEIFGPFSTLKSFVGLSAIATTQRAGGVCALVDTEHSYDEPWAKAIGVDTKALLMPPKEVETGEEAIDVTEAMIRSGVDLVVWDSVAATLPQAERSKRLHKENVQPARLAALMSTGLRKLTSANRDTAILWINQTRISVGVMFGDPEKAAGGTALPFYATHRIALRKAGSERRDVEGFKDDGTQQKHKETYQFRVRATLEKSKLTRPHKEVMFTFDLDTGTIDEVGYLIQIGLGNGLIKKAAATWAMDGKKTVGKEAFRTWLETSPEMMNQLRTSCRGSLAPAVKTDEPVKSRRLVKRA
jgi:recombination protein RecA